MPNTMPQSITNEDLDKKKPTVLGAPATPQARPVGPSSSGRFVNLQKVIGANTGNKLGSNIAQQSQNIAGQAKSNLGKSQASFQQQADTNRLDTEANRQARQSALSRLSYGGTGPTEVTDEQAQQFGKFREGAYKGPQELEGSTQLAGQARALSGIKEGIGTTAGRGQLLQRFYGQPSYTSGQRGLDTLLLGQSAGQLSPQLQDVKRTALQVGSGIDAAKARAQGLTAGAAKFGQESREQLTGTRTAAETALDEKAKQAEVEKQAKVKSLQDLIAGEGDVELTPEQMAEYGITEGQGLLSNFGEVLDISKTAANRQNVATAQDYARMQGLSKLGGQVESEFTNPDATAETFYKNQLKLDSDRANAMIQQRISDAFSKSPEMESARFFANERAGQAANAGKGAVGAGLYAYQGEPEWKKAMFQQEADKYKSDYMRDLAHYGLTADDLSGKGSVHARRSFRTKKPTTE